MSNPNLLDEEWAVIMKLLPDGWRELAREKRAIRRDVGQVQSPELLLRILMVHLAGGVSLRQTAARAAANGWADVSDVALFKKLRQSGPWFESMCTQMAADRFQSSSFDGRRVRAIDATTVEEPGSSGTSYRVHYSFCLNDFHCDHFEVTDAKGGEKLARFPASPGDILLADRGYSHREGVRHILNTGADVVVRYNHGCFPLAQRSDGEPFDTLGWLRTLKGEAAASVAVQFVAGQEVCEIRVCARRKSRAAANTAKEKLRRVASKKCKSVDPVALEFAEYIVVVTSLKGPNWTSSRVLELYRSRWQVELVFKRLKSLLDLGHLPKKRDDSSRAWIHGKLLVALMIERLIEQARSFSPWGYESDASTDLASLH